jgi:hypothetical protein
MKTLFITLILMLNINIFASERVELGLYLPVDGDSCAYQVVKQTNDGVIVIFRSNPTVVLTRKCAVGIDYPIKAEVVDTKTFIDLRTDRVFKYYGEY